MYTPLCKGWIHRDIHACKFEYEILYKDRGAGGAGGAIPPPPLFAADPVSNGIPRP